MNSHISKNNANRNHIKSNASETKPNENLKYIEKTVLKHIHSELSEILKILKNN